jgi:hypothetical protein
VSSLNIRASILTPRSNTRRTFIHDGAFFVPSLLTAIPPGLPADSLRFSIVIRPRGALPSFSSPPLLASSRPQPFITTSLPGAVPPQLHTLRHTEVTVPLLIASSLLYLCLSCRPSSSAARSIRRRSIRSSNALVGISSTPSRTMLISDDRRWQLWQSVQGVSLHPH